MIPLSIAQIAHITGGTLADITVEQAQERVISTSVEFDSRAIRPGGLFVALPGAHSDGHQWAHQAIHAGAQAVLAAHPVGVPAIIAPSAQHLHPQATVLEHDDSHGSAQAVLVALARLARYVVEELITTGLTVIAITGSSGKTTTKDSLCAILSSLGPTVGPPGSFNNELGLPWTALQATTETRYLVVEMSARHRGNIADLTLITPPQIGVLLNIGTAHLGQFGSLEEICHTKAELAYALGTHDTLIANIDDPNVKTIASHTHAHVIDVSAYPHGHIPQFWAGPIELDHWARPHFPLHHGPDQIPISSPICGEHQVTNLLCAAAAASCCGASLSQIQHGLAQMTLPAHRMSITTTPQGLTIIDDTYNANPDSMKAALQSLAWISTYDPTHPKRSWAVLGKMHELGAASREAHHQLGQLVVRLNIRYLLVVGEDNDADTLYHAAIMEGSWNFEVLRAHTHQQALDLLAKNLDPHDVILVKGSRSEHLDELVEELTSLVLRNHS